MPRAPRNSGRDSLCSVPMSVAHSRSSHAASADTLLSLVDSPRLGDTPHSGCGGTPCTSEPGSPRGLPTRPIVKESDARRLSPPCQSPPTSCRGGMGTNSSIMYAASGGNHSDTSPRGPRDHARSGLDLACYACRISPHGKSPVSNWLRCTCSHNSTSCSVSGGSPLYHIPLDPRGRAEVTRSARHSHSRVVLSPRSASSISATDFMQQQVVESQQVVVGTNTPFHPHQPLDLRLHPRPRSPSGLPCESARDVNSTPKHGDGSGNWNRHADLVPFPRHALRTNDSACGADPDTAPQGNPVATSRILERVSQDQAEQHRKPVSDGSVSASNSFGSVVAGHRLLKTQSPPLEEASAANTAATTLMEPLTRKPESHSPSGQESVATIDFAKQFYLHRLHGIDAQVDRMVATETDWVARLRTTRSPTLESRRTQASTPTCLTRDSS